MTNDTTCKMFKSTHESAEDHRKLQSQYVVVVVVVFRYVDAEKAHDSLIFKYSKCVPARSIPIEKTIRLASIDNRIRQ